MLIRHAIANTWLQFTDGLVHSEKKNHRNTNDLYSVSVWRGICLRLEMLSQVTETAVGTDGTAIEHKIYSHRNVRVTLSPNF